MDVEKCVVNYACDCDPELSLLQSHFCLAFLFQWNHGQHDKLLTKSKKRGKELFHTNLKRNSAKPAGEVADGTPVESWAFKSNSEKEWDGIQHNLS